MRNYREKNEAVTRLMVMKNERDTVVRKEEELSHTLQLLASQNMDSQAGG